MIDYIGNDKIYSVEHLPMLEIKSKKELIYDSSDWVFY
jgi:hypothetical protein